MHEPVRRRQFDNALASVLHGDALVGKILAGRGVTSDKELELSLQRLQRPKGFKGLDAAVALLAEAIAQKNRILIVGDYDADGATSTALAIDVLGKLGASVDYLVPNRFEYGYGLSTAIVDVACQKSPDLILTVDNGIASNEGVHAAKAAGITVVVTDHHLPPEQLPAADAIVNPNQPGCEFGSKNLCGVGVIFYVMAGLCRHLQAADWFENHHIPAMADYLDLVALGTVADVVPLDHNNRILIEQGLRRIRSGVARPGILALFDVASRDHRNATTDDLSFMIGPRLNAAGRLDDISVGIECLLSKELTEALPVARQLDEFNRKRRQIETGMRDQGIAQVEEIIAGHEGEMPYALSVYRPDWHEGVIGILASRLKEHCHRPVFAFAKSADGTLKGSGRSVPGIHIRDVLVAMVAEQPGLLSKFGGHAMAAGVSLPEKHINAFASAFNRQVEQLLNGKVLQREWLTDGALSESEFTLSKAALIKYLQPWGQSFPPPLFDDIFEISNVQPIGTAHMRLKLRCVNGRRELPAVAFNRRVEAQPDERWHIVYRLDVNTYKNRQSLQLVVEHLTLAD